jgi:hypothetical protein
LSQNSNYKLKSNHDRYLKFFKNSDIAPSEGISFPI